MAKSLLPPEAVIGDGDGDAVTDALAEVVPTLPAVVVALVYTTGVVVGALFRVLVQFADQTVLEQPKGTRCCSTLRLRLSLA
jgi:hypothetical protein